MSALSDRPTGPGRGTHFKQGMIIYITIIFFVSKPSNTCPTHPCRPWWIWNYLKYDKKPDSMQLSSYYAFYSLTANPYGAGNHYCKLLSPARALEWIVIDGLRDNYHLSAPAVDAVIM